MGRNRDLIKQYPWLAIEGSEYTLIDMLPCGWRGLILDMCAEIKQALPKELLHKYQVVEAKEKWYTLRWYDYIDEYTPVPQTITNIVYKYERMSQRVCMICSSLKPRTQEVCDICQERFF